MFYKNYISNVNGQDILYVFFQNSYEFSEEFNTGGMLNKNIVGAIKDYINDNHIQFRGNLAYLVSQNIILAKLNITNNDVDTYIPIPEELEIIDVI